MIAALAGTFNVLHDGHRALFERAFSLSDDVRIGITTDRFASRVPMIPYYIRERAVRDLLKEMGKDASIFPIDDMYGPAEMMADVDILVVSEETEDNGKKVAEWRLSLNGRPLGLSVVGLIKNNGRKISASDILKGDCSKDGSADTIRIAVGSANPVKVEAVRSVMERIYGQVRIVPRDVGSGVPEQPFGDETHIGAENRARAAIGDCDLSVGIEAGVFEMYDSLYDIQHCAILDRDGVMTLGMGSGFRYPDNVIDLVRSGMTVGEAMKEIYGTDVGSERGAIGVLSKGLLDRKGLTEQSVLNAMLPRIWEVR